MGLILISNEPVKCDKFKDKQLFLHNIRNLKKRQFRTQNYSIIKYFLFLFCCEVIVKDTRYI